MNTAIVYQEMGGTEHRFELQMLKVKYNSIQFISCILFLAGHSVAMVTNCATTFTATCLSRIGKFFDTMILASPDKEWL